MVPVIPKLQSRHIPVHSNDFVTSSNIHWWKSSSPFIYPNVLINLTTCKKEQMDELRKDCVGELFLLTDSGGFQILNGTCNLTWKTSLEKQIELGATKIFSLDTPPVKLVKGTLNQFKKMTEEETKKIIEENFDLALKQSIYLKENHPEEFKKFCYVAQSINKSDLDFNISLFDKIGGEDKYSDYFPGGIVYTTKTSDLLMITIAARHAYDHFIKKGIYVHYLGLGSFNRFLILVRNKITTFDSSSCLQGVRTNTFVNPTNVQKNIMLPTKDFLFSSQFCMCPVCCRVDYNKFLEEEKFVMVGRHFIAHNLWYMMQFNVLIDGIPLPKYKETINKLYKISDIVNLSLDFCDYADKNGFDVAYEKYKHHLKKDETKQKTLF